MTELSFWTQSAEKPANNRKTPGLEIQRNQPNYECHQLFYLLPSLWEGGWSETGGKAKVVRRLKTKRFYRTTHFKINLLSDITIGYY